MRSHVSDNRMILNSPSLYFLKGNTSLCALNFKTNIYMEFYPRESLFFLPCYWIKSGGSSWRTSFLFWDEIPREREREREMRRTHQLHHLPFLPRLKNKNPYPFLEFPYPPRKLKSPSVQESTIFPEKICKKGRNRERIKEKGYSLRNTKKKKKKRKFFPPGQNQKIKHHQKNNIIHTQKHGGNFTPNHFLIRSMDRRLDRINRD